MQCEILKPFKSEGVLLERGQAVDASRWRTRNSLIARRYMRPVDGVEIDECRVLKPFRSKGRLLERGQIISTRDWRRRDLLIDQRFIAPLENAPDKPEISPAVESVYCQAMSKSGKPCTRKAKPGTRNCGLKSHAAQV